MGLYILEIPKVLTTEFAFFHEGCNPIGKFDIILPTLQREEFSKYLLI